MTLPSVRTRHPRRPFPILALLVALLAVAVSLASVVSTHAMPVEARSTEPWYGYEAKLGFDYTVQVRPGKFYETPVVSPTQLIKVRGPMEPPVYRRVLLSRFTDSISVVVPYQFKADREAPLTARLRIDGMLVLPGIWQKPYPILAQKEFTVTGAEISGQESFTIPVGALLADMEDTRVKYGIYAEPMEIQMKAVFEVEAAGLKEPVASSSVGEYTVSMRQNTIEIDDAREIRSQKDFADTQIVPITVGLFGWRVKVAVIRQISLVALVVFLLAAVGIVWFRRTKPDSRALLEKLGPNLISARSFELPGDTAIVDVRTVREFLQLQAQSERPVIVAKGTYYLQDGTTCYRFHLASEESDT